MDRFHFSLVTEHHVTCELAAESEIVAGADLNVTLKILISRFFTNENHVYFCFNIQVLKADQILLIYSINCWEKYIPQPLVQNPRTVATLRLLVILKRFIYYINVSSLNISGFLSSECTFIFQTGKWGHVLRFMIK